MRLGIYGGTFDPVHYGHLLLAEQCREQLGLDEVWFVPAGSPPHKQDTKLTPDVRRAEMLEFAVAGHPEFHVNRLEFGRTGPSYTVDTLRQIRQDFPEHEPYFLIGADSLADLPLWREPRAIVDLATLVVVNRGVAPLPRLELLEPHLGAEALTRIQILSMPAIDLASRDIRQRAHTGRSIRYMTPRAVERYILENSLYRDE